MYEVMTCRVIPCSMFWKHRMYPSVVTNQIKLWDIHALEYYDLAIKIRESSMYWEDLKDNNNNNK